MRGLRIHDADRRAGDSRRNGRAERAVRTACELAHVCGRVQGAWQCATGSAQDWRDRDTYSRSIVTRGFSVDVMCLSEVASASRVLVRPVDARLVLKWYSPYVIALHVAAACKYPSENLGVVGTIRRASLFV